MADAVDMKISQLDAAVSVADADVFPESSGAVSKKVPASVLKNYMIGTNDISALGDGSVTGAILNVKSTSETADSNIAETMAKNGAHNLCPFPYYSGGTQIISGFTLTVNDNGTMVASGTANEASRFNLYVGKLPKNIYKFRFNGSLSGADIAIYDYVTEQVIDSAGANEDITLTVDATNENHNFLLYINWSSGSISISGGPLLRLASDPSTDYTPYAMTNGELTEGIKRLKDVSWSFSASDTKGFLLELLYTAYTRSLFDYVGESFGGIATWTGHNVFDFIVRQISDTTYEVLAWEGDAMYTARYTPSTSTYVACMYTGTQL